MVSGKHTNSDSINNEGMEICHCRAMHVWPRGVYVGICVCIYARVFLQTKTSRRVTNNHIAARLARVSDGPNLIQDLRKMMRLSLSRSDTMVCGAMVCNVIHYLSAYCPWP